MKQGMAYRQRRGNAVLEAALVLPVLLCLAFGTVEFGCYFYIKDSLQGAAREGARVAVLSNATNANVRDKIASYMSAFGLQNSGYTVTITPSDIGSVPAGTDITVKVECPWGRVGVRPMQLMSATKPVGGMAVMRKES